MPNAIAQRYPERSLEQRPMPTRPAKPKDQQIAPTAVRIFATNERLNQILLENLDPGIWTAQPPGGVRAIAAIFTHTHNVRTKWIRLTAPHLKVPAQLNRTKCTRQQASAALAASAATCEQMLTEALTPNGRITKFRRDSWGSPWPAGLEMLSYMLTHEAHHRGQVCMLAHQLGSPLPNKITSDLWNWEKLWRNKNLSS
jgi:uncharacterized damage-inducible protein DinB